INFTDDAEKAVVVLNVKNEYKLAHAAVKYADGASADYYDTISTVDLVNRAGKSLYSRSCVSPYGAPKVRINKGERSFRAVALSGDDCAGIADDIARLFENDRRER
ncbi:hypothetical protein LJC48_04145, partial [Desulfovibrio sp. OttesenSCG-928-C06]|nr:hypothetical protein [Desulfovibrio sp. OttesenSCG-928-C06]